MNDIEKYDDLIYEISELLQSARFLSILIKNASH